jgi:hypothetical protein
MEAAAGKSSRRLIGEIRAREIDLVAAVGSTRPSLFIVCNNDQSK